MTGGEDPAGDGEAPNRSPADRLAPEADDRDGGEVGTFPELLRIPGVTLQLGRARP